MAYEIRDAEGGRGVSEKMTPIFINREEGFRRLLNENPELPIVSFILVDVREGCQEIDCSIRAEIGEVLNCTVKPDEGRVYYDREDLEEDLRFYLDGITTDSEEEFEQMIKDQMKMYEPYWVKCIIVWAYA